MHCLFGGSMMGLMATSSKRSYDTYATLHDPGLLKPEPLSLWQATSDLRLCRRHSNTQRQVWLSLPGLLSFPGTPQQHSPRSALCLLWEADPRLLCSWQMSTIQDTRKTWLATGSLLTVWWKMSSLGPRLHQSLASHSGCPCLPLCLRGGRALYSGRLALLWCFGECARGDHVVLESFKDHGIRSHHFMANRKTVDTVTVFIYLDSKITADGDCSHEIKRRLVFLGRKAITNLDSILKSREIAVYSKVRLLKAMVFPVVIYGCDS